MLNGVHGGLPMMMKGLSFLINSMARALLVSSLKSQGLPSSGSFWVRSSANPGLSLNLLAKAVTLGGLDISVTCTLIMLFIELITRFDRPS